MLETHYIKTDLDLKKKKEVWSVNGHTSHDFIIMCNLQLLYYTSFSFPIPVFIPRVQVVQYFQASIFLLHCKINKHTLHKYWLHFQLCEAYTKTVDRLWNTLNRVASPLTVLLFHHSCHPWIIQEMRRTALWCFGSLSQFVLSFFYYPKISAKQLLGRNGLIINTHT